MSQLTHHVSRRFRRAALASAAVAAVASAVTAGPAAASTQPQVVPDLVFSVGDGESPEGYLFRDPNCPPDISCKGQRVAGEVTFKVTTNVSLAGQPITVRYATVDGTARQPGDYRAETGALTFQPGDFAEYVTVTLNINPGGAEPTEQFFLQLSDPSIPGDTSDRGVGTIIDGIEVVE
jgi:hypothetical protein